MAVVSGHRAQSMGIPRRSRGCSTCVLVLLVGALLLAGPVLAQDAGADSGSPAEVPSDMRPPLSPQELPATVELPVRVDAQSENSSLGMLAGIKDITELSLEDLLNAGMTTSTKSKPMSMRDSPNVMTVVTREEIQRSGARELADVLRLVPGFQLGGDLYSSVYAGFRGIWGSEGKFLVLLDGHEMFELLYYATELGNRIPVDQIERIEIIRGPGSVVYGGSAELAVVNIITRSAE